jgi:hypothetical protein
MDKDFPCKPYAHKKDRPQMERPLPNLMIKLPQRAQRYSAAKNFRMRSRPRSNSAFDVA